MRKVSLRALLAKLTVIALATAPAPVAAANDVTDAQLVVDREHIDERDAAACSGAASRWRSESLPPLEATHVASELGAVRRSGAPRSAVAHALEWTFPLVGDGLDHRPSVARPRSANPRGLRARRMGPARDRRRPGRARPARRRPRPGSPRNRAGQLARCNVGYARAAPAWYRTTVLETLAKGFRAARQRLTGVAELNDDIIEEALRDVRLSLLEGDVEFQRRQALPRARQGAGARQAGRAARQERGVRRQVDHARAGVRRDLPGRAHQDDGPGRHRASSGRRRARPAS